MNYIYGKNPVKEHLKKTGKGTLYLRKTINRHSVQDILDLAGAKKIKLVYLENAAFDKRFPQKNNQGIVLESGDESVRLLTEKDFQDFLNTDDRDRGLVLILDRISDPGNLGAVLRSALLFNVDYVILPRDNSASINDIVIKRSCGAVFHLNICYVPNLVRIINLLKESHYWIYAADLDGEKVDKTVFHGKSALVMGDEGRGIRPLVKKNCDYTVTIPTNGKLDSLNLSVSTGIILYELNKQLIP